MSDFTDKHNAFYVSYNTEYDDRVHDITIWIRKDEKSTERALKKQLRISGYKNTKIHLISYRLIEGATIA